MNPLIKRLAARAGVRLDADRWADNKKVPQYNGQTVACDGLTDSEILHEIAHFVVSPDAYRFKPNFGLGSGFLGGYARRLVPEEEAEEQEHDASALGIAFERALGLDWEATVFEHNWRLRDLEEHLEALQRRGFLDVDCFPFLLKDDPHEDQAGRA